MYPDPTIGILGIKLQIFCAEGAKNFEKLRFLRINGLFWSFKGKIWLNFDQYSGFVLIRVQKYKFFSILKKLKMF